MCAILMVTRRTLRLLKLLQHSTHWFDNGYPIIRLPNIKFHLKTGIIEYQKYISADKNATYNLLYTYLSNFKVEYTNVHYPYLIFPDFIWKEDIFYSSNIKIKYINTENPETKDPTQCKSCRKYYIQEYKLLVRFCSSCKHKISANMRKIQSKSKQ